MLLNALAVTEATEDGARVVNVCVKWNVVATQISWGEVPAREDPLRRCSRPVVLAGSLFAVRCLCSLNVQTGISVTDVSSYTGGCVP